MTEDVKADLYETISTKEHDAVANLLAIAKDYIDWVFDGNDPTKTPDNASWYHHPLVPYARNIVNAYREQQGQTPIPYSPDTTAFRGFMYLADARDQEGGDSWRSAKSIQARLFGHHVEAILQPHRLRESGWMLDKTTIGGKVHYRLVKVESIVG